MVSFKEFIEEKRVAKKRYSNEFKYQFRKLKHAETDAERAEILSKLMLFIKLMSPKEAAHVIKTL